MDKNKCLEIIQNILNNVFNGYYETRILRQDINEEEWAHAIHIAKRMPLTTLFEEQKRDELVKYFEHMKSSIIPVEPGLQPGFVQPPEGKVTAASTEEPVEVDESPEEPATEETVVEPDPVETIVEASEPAEEIAEETATEKNLEEAPAEETKSHRRKK